MEKRVSLNFIYPNGSMQEMMLKWFRCFGAYTEENSTSVYDCIRDLDLGPVYIDRMDSYRTQDIPILIERGIFDFGLVGLDWVRERKSEVEVLATFALSRSTFKPVSLVLAAPKALGLRSVNDLPVNAVVATEYPVTAKDYFDRNQRSDIEVLLSYGDTESKILLGVADVIVDIVETGNSLIRNGLSVIETISTSEMALVAKKESLADSIKGEVIRKFAQMAEDCYRLLRLQEKR